LIKGIKAYFLSEMEHDFILNHQGRHSRVFKHLKVN
jgi:hypothetical protein